MNITQNSHVGTYANAAFVSDLESLSVIHKREKNVAIFQRDILELKEEVEEFLKVNMDFKASGSKEEIVNSLFADKEIVSRFPKLFKDISELIYVFEKVSRCSSLRLGLFTVNSNMCRRFHTDINDIRLLCTYSGPGTLWLPDEAADRFNYQKGSDNEKIVVDTELIQQAAPGEVLLLKGALYPNADAVIHRSPSVEESGESRLLLRIDTNESLI